MPKEGPSPRERWLNRILERELPVFNATAQRVVAVVSNEKASIGELNTVVLQDQALTARILRMANSVGFHPGGPPVTSVSRSIMIMGFVHVHDLVLDVGLVEALLEGAARRNVQQLMARAHHAAAQARRIAVARRDLNPDEIHLTALLYRIGEMAFWCCAGDTAEALQQRVRADGGRTRDAEYDLLGFRLYQLNKDLAKLWELHPLLTEVTQRVIRPDTREYPISLGWRIAELAEAGWEHERMETQIERISDFLRERRQTVKRMIYNTARQAVKVAASYTDPLGAALIPDPPGLLEETPGNSLIDPA